MKNGTSGIKELLPFLHCWTFHVLSGWTEASSFYFLSKCFSCDWVASGHFQKPSGCHFGIALIHSGAERLSVAPNWGHACPWTDFPQGYVCTVIHSYVPTTSQASELQLLKNIFTTWCFHHRALVWDGLIWQVMSAAWIPLKTLLHIQEKEIFFLSLAGHSVFFSWPGRPLVAFWQTWSNSGHSTIKAWLMECCRDGCQSGRFSMQDIWTSIRGSFGCFVRFLKLISLTEWPDSC